MASNVLWIHWLVNIDSLINVKSVKTVWLDAEAATALLGINRATLYAYVSRGHIRSEPVPGKTRRRRYARDDIERLLARTRERRNPEKAAEQVLHWGLPVLESAITLIADEHIYYRGQDLAALARSSSLADVAALIWTGTADGSVFDPPEPYGSPSPMHAGAPFIARAQSTLALAAAHDPLAYDLRPRAAAQTGWRILRLLARVAAGTAKQGPTIDATLAAAWNVSASADLIRAALILCADHELNVSAFTARCVASAGAAPHGVVIAGLAALEGTKHGGTTARVEATWEALRKSRDLALALGERLRRGESIDGFGHPLYPHGDPRAAILLELLPKSREATFGRALSCAAQTVLGEAPTVDFALVALARSLNLPPGAALTLFAIGRTIGWIGHAIEQYEKDAIIRPRAKYVGVMPTMTSA
jgi:citrate synthase